MNTAPRSAEPPALAADAPAAEPVLRHGPRTVAAAASNRLAPRDLAAGTLVVAGREIGAYFDSAIAYVYTIAFALLANAIFMNEFFLTGRVDMTGYFEVMPLLFAFFVPAITMRLWAEERRQRTVELLLTLPIRPLQAVLGKYLASLALLGVFLLSSLPIVVMLEVLGDPDLGLILSGYIGLALLGGLFLAFGMFLSALSADQIVAFVTSTVAAFALVLLGNDRVVAVIDGLFPGIAAGTLLYENISIGPRYDAFVRGAIELSSILWFALLSALFLWAQSLVLERNRA